jgi:gas vesicle protein
MRDCFDKDMAARFGKNEGGGSFMMGLLTGTVVGVGLGMLLAPKAGSELRNQLSDQAGALANQAQEGYRKATENAGQWAEKGKQAAGEWAERGKDLYGKAREAVSRGTDEAQQHVRDAAGTVTSATSAPATASSTGSSASGSPSSSASSPTSYPRNADWAGGSELSSGPSAWTLGVGGGPRRS